MRVDRLARWIAHAPGRFSGAFNVPLSDIEHHRRIRRDYPGLAFYKSKFDPQWLPRYLLVRDRGMRLFGSSETRLDMYGHTGLEFIFQLARS